MDEPIRVDTPTRVIDACDYPQIYRPKYFTATEQTVHWHNALRELEFELWKATLNRAIGNPVEEVLIQRMLDQIAATENLCKQVMGGGYTTNLSAELAAKDAALAAKDAAAGIYEPPT